MDLLKVMSFMELHLVALINSLNVIYTITKKENDFLNSKTPWRMSFKLRSDII